VDVGEDRMRPVIAGPISLDQPRFGLRGARRLLGAQNLGSTGRRQGGQAKQGNIRRNDTAVHGAGEVVQGVAQVIGG
jgi:hypothetical protein